MDGQSMTGLTGNVAAGWGGWWSGAELELAGRDYRAGDREAAARRCREIIAHDAWNFDALHLLGVTHLERSQFADAITYLDRASRVSPDSASALFQLGSALSGRERYDAAITAFRQTLTLAPGHVDTLNMMGNALAALGRFDEAIAAFDQALAIQPGYPPALFNRGKRLVEAGRIEEAVDSFRAALKSAGPKADPARLGDIHAELGRALLELDRPEEALAVTRAMQALKDVPGRAEWHESLVLLALGQYAEGWEKYEFRYSVEGRTPPHKKARPLDLAEVPGKHVLICAEQGFGDTIQFARYAGMLARAGATVSLAVDPELKSLLQQTGDVAKVIAFGEEEPAFDLVTAFPSLPLAFHTELTSIPADTPYLRAPATQLAAWRKRLGGTRKPRIGICCWGSRHISHRSIPIAALAPVLKRTDVELHLLQKEISPSDRTWLAAHPAVHEHSDALADFADTAALISHLDLVITIDTAVAHLAGALARPVWIMLQFSADWRWLIGRDDSPWYPTARLFRQPRRGDWDAVVAAVSQALDAHRFSDFQARKRPGRNDRSTKTAPNTGD
jgi:tetratricopeptide (TPR) repeat protein